MEMLTVPEADRRCGGDGSTINSFDDNDSLKISKSSYHVSSGGFMRGVVFWSPISLLPLKSFKCLVLKLEKYLLRLKGQYMSFLVVACGVCHSDLHVIKGEIPFRSPCAIGHEITGEVVEHGKLSDRKTIERFPVGSRVVGAFIMPCGNCFYCSKLHIVLVIMSSLGILEMQRKINEPGRGDGHPISYCCVFVCNEVVDSVILVFICLICFLLSPYQAVLNCDSAFIWISCFTCIWRIAGKPISMYSMGGLTEYCVVPAHGLTILPNSLPYCVYCLWRYASCCSSASWGFCCCDWSWWCWVKIARAFGASDIIAVDVQDEKLEKAKTFGATATINSKIKASLILSPRHLKDED
uniref:Uncharacterized protein n=1 Tax=Salix viminalis TaxID=40686 RepID=A0A6N2KSS0_SALVM